MTETDGWSAFLRWAWRWIACVVILSSAAYVVAYVAQPDGLAFLGFLANNDDNQLYLSFMREGAQGAWLTTIRFTPEAHEPILLLPVYQVLGKIARMLGASNELVFHLARVASGVALLVATYAFARTCLPANWTRQSAFLLACFSSGLGWLLIVLRLADVWVVPVDVRIPEINTFLTIFTSPHFALGITFELLTLLFFVGAGRRPGYLLGAGICLLCLSITLVYNVIVTAVALVLYTAARAWQQRRWQHQDWLRLVLVGMVAAPVIAYYYVIFRFDPFWRIAYGEHDVVRSPHLVALALGYGLVLALAAWGMALWVRGRQWTSPRIMLATWAASNGLLLYVPLAFQGKLAAGWHIALCLLAAVGLHEGFLPWLSRRAWFGRQIVRSPNALRTARNVVLILTIPSTLLVALIGLRVVATEHYFPYYLPVADVQAVKWLSSRVDSSDVVLSSYGIGNYMVAHSDARSFLGHQFAVIDPRLKDRMLRDFFSGALDRAGQRDLVEKYGITFVLHGSLERTLGSWEADAPWLVPVYLQGGTAIYAVQED